MEIDQAGYSEEETRETKFYNWIARLAEGGEANKDDNKNKTWSFGSWNHDSLFLDTLDCNKEEFSSLCLAALMYN